MEKIAIFEGKKIRRQWDEKKELWLFSVVDVVAILSDSINARKYWNKLSERLRKEGSEVVTKCHQLKFQSSDGKYYLSDAGTARRKLEKRTGKKVITNLNAKELKLIEE